MQNKRLRTICRMKAVILAFMLPVLLSGCWNSPSHDARTTVPDEGNRSRAWAGITGISLLDIPGVSFSTQHDDPFSVDPSLALNAAGVPYVAYKDRENRGKLSVAKFEGGAWVPVGSRGFSPELFSHLSPYKPLRSILRLDVAGVLHVAYRDSENNDKLTVMRLEGDAWVSVGPPIQAGEFYSPTLVLSTVGIPYVSYVANMEGDKVGIFVMKLEGDAWVSVGPPVKGLGTAHDVGTPHSLALNAAGVPYVAYWGFGDNTELSVMKLEEGSWISVGSSISLGPNVHSENSDCPSLVLDAAGVPYVAYTDKANNGRLSVMRLEKGAWVSVGPLHASPKAAEYPFLTLDATGAPIVAYMYRGFGFPPELKLWITKHEGGAWVPMEPPGGIPEPPPHVGPPGLSLRKMLFWSDPNFPSLALDADGVPYASYIDIGSMVIDNRDFSNDGKLSVMKFDGNAWVPVGSRGFSSGRTGFSSLTLNIAGVPYVIYDNWIRSTTEAGVFKSEILVMKFEGRDWVPVGPPLPRSSYYFSLAVDATGVPYVAYIIRGKFSVLKLEEGAWVFAATPDTPKVGNYVSLALDAVGTPYIAYGGSRVSVIKFEEGAWVPVGPPNISLCFLSCIPSLVLDATGVPYVAYSDSGNNNKLSVVKLEGDAWVSVGSPGISSGPAVLPYLKLDANGVPTVVYMDYIGEGKDRNHAFSVKEFKNGEWVSVGPPEISPKALESSPSRKE